MVQMAELETVPETIEATLNYFVDTGTRPITMVGAPGGSDVRSGGGEADPHRVVLRNGRLNADSFADRGSEPTGSGATVWDRPADSSLGASGRSPAQKLSMVKRRARAHGRYALVEVVRSITGKGFATEARTLARLGMSGMDGPQIRRVVGSPASSPPLLHRVRASE